MRTVEIADKLLDGASLARLEGEIGLSRLFERFHGLTRAGTPALGPNAALRGYIHVPTRLSG